MKKQLLTLFFLAAMLMSGIGLKAQEITITLYPGYNWICYPNAVEMDVSSALGDFVPMDGDTLKSRNANACYVDGRWKGNLKRFTPGKGYVYYSTRTDTTSFVFMAEASPYVETTELTHISVRSALVTGTVDMPEGSRVYQRGVCWGTEPNPSIVDDNHTSKVNEIGNGNVSNTIVNDTIVGLDPASSYYVRAYVISDRGTFFSENEKINYLISTDSVTNISGNGATCWGTIPNNNGLNVIERGICWCRESDDGTPPNINNIDIDFLNDSQFRHIKEDPIGSGDVFSITITDDLKPNTSYYMYAYFITGRGDAGICKNGYDSGGGNSMYCQTLPGIPDVSMDSVTVSTDGSVTFFGSVTNNNGMEVTERGFYYDTISDPVTNGTKILASSAGTVNFRCIMTGLEEDITYYVRAYAITGQGTGYSDNEMSFTLYTINVSANLGGTVSGGGTYCHGDTCTLTATANTGYTFTNWTENGNDVSTNSTYSFQVTGTRTLVANFTPTYTITVSANPTNGGTVTGNGTYQQGQQCTVSATPATGYIFTNWTENGIVVSTSASYTFTVNSNRTLVANFNLKSYTISASASPTAGGSVSGADTYNHGSTCTLTATANTGYTFTEWTKNGTRVSTSASYSFTVTGSGTYVANFSHNVPTGAISGQFTINSNSSNNKVYFSQGNLQYQASTNTWRFAENQYDCVGSANSNVSSTYSEWIDMFGWGTSGFAHGAVCYQPWSTNTSYSKYYAYGHNNYHLYNSTGKADWGYNKISNGGNTVNSGWRTLTTEEWKYVLYTRNPSGPRFAKAKVCGVNGLILLPDGWNTSWYTLNSMNSRVANFSVNTINETQWQILEQHGAVFLPAAGYRYGTSVSCVDSHGYYWSASYDCNSDACRIGFSNTSLSWQDYTNRCYGHSVRLVRTAN